MIFYQHPARQGEEFIFDDKKLAMIAHPTLLSTHYHVTESINRAA